MWKKTKKVWNFIYVKHQTKMSWICNKHIMQWGDVVSNNYFIVVWKMYSCILPSIDVQQMNSLWKNLQTTNNVKLILFVSRFGRQF